MDQTGMNTVQLIFVFVFFIRKTGKFCHACLSLQFYSTILLVRGSGERNIIRAVCVKTINGLL